MSGVFGKHKITEGEARELVEAACNAFELKLQERVAPKSSSLFSFFQPRLPKDDVLVSPATNSQKAKRPGKG